MTVSHHRWPMKPPPEPAAIERPAPVQTRYVDLRELRKAIDRYCREQKRLNKSARRSTPICSIIQPLFGRHRSLESGESCAQKARGARIQRASARNQPARAPRSAFRAAFPVFLHRQDLGELIPIPSVLSIAKFLARFQRRFLCGADLCIVQPHEALTVPWRE